MTDKHIDELAFLDAIAQAELVRNGEVATTELVEATIQRIERLNPTVNAVVTRAYESAREAASATLPDAPLAGVPFLLKDIGSSAAGMRITGASNLLGDFVPDHDDELVARFKRAGLIIMGKTNVPELGLSGTTEPLRHGPTRNPWNKDLSAGGSSGGAAAAVASGMVPLAHAGDGAGSTRVPASCCGLFGLKTSRSMNPLPKGAPDTSMRLASEHVLTRSVRDSAAALDATHGASPFDPYMRPQVQSPFIEEISKDPGELRIAVSTVAPNGVVAHGDCSRAVEDAIGVCEELGHKVEEDRPPVDEEQYARTMEVLWGAICCHFVEDAAHTSGNNIRQDLLEPQTWAWYEDSKQLTAADFMWAMRHMIEMQRQCSMFFERYDV
jgi:amidase